MHGIHILIVDCSFQGMRMEFGGSWPLPCPGPGEVFSLLCASFCQKKHIYIYIVCILLYMNVYDTYYGLHLYITILLFYYVFMFLLYSIVYTLLTADIYIYIYLMYV